MDKSRITRRTFCKTTGITLAALSGLNLLPIRGVHAATEMQNVPHSSGVNPPKLQAPTNACDCHMHIYDSRFRPSPHWKKKPSEAPVDAYRLFQKRIGTTRNVVVTPSTYGTDNSCTLDALEQLGSTARGIAVVDTEVSNEELKRLNDSGICGIRVNFVSAQSWGVTTTEMLETLANRVSEFGWHVQILMSADQIVETESVLRGLPVPVVIDHLGRIPQPDGINHPAVKTILNLLENPLML
jgi:predicted TIM-barrel fold metal-dependent hydrolase